MKVNPMKTNKTTILFTVILSLAALASVSCNRDNVTQPSAIGPSSIGVMLNVDTSPNVLVAGVTQRQRSTVTATLKKYDGTGQANRTITFEVVDSTGARLNLGSFDGGAAVVSKATDAGGIVTVGYLGPLSDEITSDTTIIIRASVAWDGSQTIDNTATLAVVRDTKQLSLSAVALPDILYASGSNPSSTIQATVLSGGQPVRNFPVFFLLDHNLGSFSDGKLYTYVNTNNQGVASLTYIGPTADDMSNSSDTATITVLVSQDILKELKILVIRQK